MICPRKPRTTILLPLLASFLLLFLFSKSVLRRPVPTTDIEDGIPRNLSGASDNLRREDCANRHCQTVTVRSGEVTSNGNNRRNFSTKIQGPITTTRDTSTRKRLPQAFIIGAGKCGTGTLRKFLSAHPNIVIHSIEEMWFYDNFYKKGPSWHLSYMPLSRPDQITIESSPGYFHHPAAMARITKDNPHGLFILLLRDPVARAISHFIHNANVPSTFVNFTAPDFEKAALSKKGRVNEAWHPIDYGVYSRVLKRWLKLVPLQRILVIDGTDFAKNPLPHLQRVEKFLKVPSFFDESKLVYDEGKGFYCLKLSDGRATCMPASKGREHPVINPTVIKKLRAFYRPYNKELYRLIGRHFNW